VADEVVIVHRGKFVEQASTADLSARMTGGIRVRSPQAERLRALLEQAGLGVTSAEGDLLMVGEGSTERIGEVAAANGIVLHELAAEKATLE
jgi:ABC-2 type transport system ATP-binding protein